MSADDTLVADLGLGDDGGVGVDIGCVSRGNVVVVNGFLGSAGGVGVGELVPPLKECGGAWGGSDDIRRFVNEQHKVPHYVLVSSSSRTQPSTATGSATPVLSHPIIQYHYANESPLSLLPRSPNEQVLVLDYDPLNPKLSRAQSISGSSAVYSIKYPHSLGVVSLAS
ncbi:hypothetical protein F5148DRAFT_1225263 [Russula earlei]|uniref:Uncharacterized protein n=2 Tax=Russula earlei TaxID=71964 RepID=A0ACC0U0G1_9AGAM|nr:hypothetical protein F5148DRAFT_1225263 [Russula earlei]